MKSSRPDAVQRLVYQKRYGTFNLQLAMCHLLFRLEFQIFYIKSLQSVGESPKIFIKIGS